MSVTANTGTVTPVVGNELTVATISGGPLDNVTAFVQGGTSGDGQSQLVFKLYAVVGALTVLVAERTVIASDVASILQFQNVGGGTTTQLVDAGGTSYVLTVVALPTTAQPRAVVKGTLAGVDSFDTATDTTTSASLSVPAFATASSVDVSGYCQRMDVGLDQNALPQQTTIAILANNGVGSFEAIVKSVTLAGPDSVTAVLRQVELPVASVYRVVVTNNTTTPLTVPISIATYSVRVALGPSSLTPGPQITVLRSVTPTTPSRVVWASTGYVDFIADCGADPTGVADIAPALDRAFVLLSSLAANPKLAETAVELYVPPGLFALKSAPATTVWNFVGLTTGITIRGAGDASMIEFHGFDFPQIANAYRIYARDFVMVGAGDASSNDCVVGLALNAIEAGAVERVKIFNLLAGDACISLQGGYWSVRDCNVGSTGAVNEAVFWVNQTLKLEFADNYCVDISALNGYTGSITNKNAGNTAWLRYEGNPSFPNQCAGVVIKRCIFDEGCLYNVGIFGSALAPISFVRFEAVYFNPAIHASNVSCVIAQSIDTLEVDGMIDSGFTTSTSALAMQLLDVTEARIIHLRINPLASSNTLTADAECGSIDLKYCDNLIVTSLAQGIVKTPSGYTAPNDWNVQL